MRERRSNFKFFAAACLLLALCVALPVSAGAASAKTKAMKAYRKFLSGSQIAWNGNTSGSYKVKLSTCSFAIAYIDNNSVPELIVTSSSLPHVAGYGILYTYKNGKVVKVANLQLNETFIYYKKKGVFLDSYFGSGLELTTVYKYSSTKITAKLGQDLNIGGGQSYTDSWYKISKSGDLTTITKAAYQKKLKSLTGGKKSTTAKFYKNTAKNRKKKLK